MLQVGRYVLVERLGKGGMGEVWRACQRSQGDAFKTVAIKLLHRDEVDDERQRANFEAEAQMSIKLTYSNIAQTFDFGETESGEIFMVMEWIDGVNLAHFNEVARRCGRIIAPAVAAYIVGEVLRGLAYAHGFTRQGVAAAIVHRDISPQNVMLSSSGEVKIVDFGIARLTSEDTTGLHIKGKPRYMAPEQVRGHSRGPAIDLFAAGAVFHELLSGRKFRDEAEDEDQLFAMAMTGAAARLDRARLPPELVATCEQLLAYAPRDRTPSAVVAFEQLRSWRGYTNASVALGASVRLLLGRGSPRAAEEPGSCAASSSDVDALTLVEDAEPAPRLSALLDDGFRAGRDEAHEAFFAGQFPEPDDDSVPAQPRAGESTATEPVASSGLAPVEQGLDLARRGLSLVGFGLLFALGGWWMAGGASRNQAIPEAISDRGEPPTASAHDDAVPERGELPEASVHDDATLDTGDEAAGAAGVGEGAAEAGELEDVASAPQAPKPDPLLVVIAGSIGDSADVWVGDVYGEAAQKAYFQVPQGRVRVRGESGEVSVEKKHRFLPGGCYVLTLNAPPEDSPVKTCTRSQRSAARSASSRGRP